MTSVKKSKQFSFPRMPEPASNGLRRLAGGKELLDRPPPELREWIVSTRVNSSRAR